MLGGDEGDSAFHVELSTVQRDSDRMLSKEKLDGSTITVGLDVQILVEVGRVGMCVGLAKGASRRGAISTSQLIRR